MSCLLLAILISGCATDRFVIEQTEKAKAQSNSVDAAAKIASQREPLPELPVDCRLEEDAGVNNSDRVDVVIKKFDNAVTRGNARIARCVSWFERLKAARERGQGF